MPPAKTAMLEGAVNESGPFMASDHWYSKASRRQGTFALVALLILVVVIVGHQFFSLLESLAVFTAVTAFQVIVLRRFVLWLQAKWIKRQGQKEHTRIAYLLKPPQSPWKIAILAPYYAATGALLTGVLVASVSRWIGDTSMDFQARAISWSAIGSIILTPFCVAIWARLYAGIREVDIRSGENWPVKDFPPMNLLKATGFIPYVFGVATATIPYWPSLLDTAKAIWMASFAVFGAFVIPVCVALAYWLLFIEKDALELRRAVEARGVRSFRDL